MKHNNKKRTDPYDAGDKWWGMVHSPKRHGLSTKGGPWFLTFRGAVEQERDEERRKREEDDEEEDGRVKELREKKRVKKGHSSDDEVQDDPPLECDFAGLTQDDDLTPGKDKWDSGGLSPETHVSQTHVVGDP
jgi:hypothetical protein